ncbi:MAG: PIN domain-containing protein [Bryobacteraceae bacterium]
MRVFFDTSVFIAVFWGNHPGHAESIDAFRHATPSDSFCGIHSLAEVYASMTAMPLRPAIAPEQAALFVEEIQSRCSPVALTEREYVDTIERAAERGLKSGVIYDALLLRCAEKADVDLIYTWNLKHFRAVNPALADKIRTP